MTLHRRSPDYAKEDWKVLDSVAHAATHLTINALEAGLLDLKQVADVWEGFEARSTQKDPGRVDTLKRLFQQVAESHNVDIHRYTATKDKEQVRLYSASASRLFATSIGISMSMQKQVPMTSDMWDVVRIFLAHTVAFIAQLIQDDVIDTGKVEPGVLVTYTLSALSFARVLAEEYLHTGDTVH